MFISESNGNSFNLVFCGTGSGGMIGVVTFGGEGFIYEDPCSRMLAPVAMSAFL